MVLRKHRPGPQAAVPHAALSDRRAAGDHRLRRHFIVILPLIAMLVLPVWGAIGLLIYFGYSRSRSHVGRGIIEVPELSSRCAAVDRHCAAAGCAGSAARTATIKRASSPASALRSASGRAP